MTRAQDLKPGDVITSLGSVTFPFPFTLTFAVRVGSYGMMLKAAHGWFTPGPVGFHEKAGKL